MLFNCHFDTNTTSFMKSIQSNMFNTVHIPTEMTLSPPPPTQLFFIFFLSSCYFTCLDNTFVLVSLVDFTFTPITRLPGIWDTIGKLKLLQYDCMNYYVVFKHTCSLKCTKDWVLFEEIRLLSVLLNKIQFMGHHCILKKCLLSNLLSQAYQIWSMLTYLTDTVRRLTLFAC